MSNTKSQSSNTGSERPSVPTDPRQCQNCYHLYEVLLLHCPQCGSDNTQFVDEDTLEETDGYGSEPVDRYHPFCTPPPRPDRETCTNDPDRTITVRFEEPGTEMEWWVCEDHAEEARNTGTVLEDREYDRSKDGYEK